MEIWTGIECTENRVEDNYISQLDKSGHCNRISDLRLIAELGIKKMRYPCLWERVAPNSLDEKNWSWIDERLKEAQKLKITPVIGFLHHGSGPKYTHLLDHDFPNKLAQYAKSFAERFPWVEDYTPINEILTTSRFSCLYGHWYPHHKSDLSFLQAVFIQCKATVLSMLEIRKINPRARLIQTDDIGKCQSTEKLKEQCKFENERKWLAFDILCGKVDANHPLFHFIRDVGIDQETLEWAQHNKLPPDIIGINHYQLSNRFLDERIHLYPAWSHGGNGRDTYADVGAMDTGQSELPSPEEIFFGGLGKIQNSSSFN